MFVFALFTIMCIVFSSLTCFHKCIMVVDGSKSYDVKVSTQVILISLHSRAHHQACEEQAVHPDRAGVTCHCLWYGVSHLFLNMYMMSWYSRTLLDSAVNHFYIFLYITFKYSIWDVMVYTLMSHYCVFPFVYGKGENKQTFECKQNVCLWKAK